MTVAIAPLINFAPVLIFWGRIYENLSSAYAQDVRRRGKARAMGLNDQYILGAACIVIILLIAYCVYTSERHQSGSAQTPHPPHASKETATAVAEIKRRVPPRAGNSVQSFDKAYQNMWEKTSHPPPTTTAGIAIDESPDERWAFNR